MTFFAKRVYKIVSRISEGKTLTYKEVAKLAGRSKAYRAVGNVLNKNRDFKRVPCYRVIRSDGKVGGYVLGAQKKRRLLKLEQSSRD